MWDAVLSAVTGGGTGLLGSLVSGVSEYFQQKEENRHDEVMMDKENDQIKLEADRDIKVSKMETTAQVEEAEAEAAAEIKSKSYESDARRYLSKGAMRDSIWATRAMAAVDFVRGMTRPTLTLYLALVSTLIYWQTYQISKAVEISPEQAFELLRISTLGILYLFGMAVAWWFGDHGKKLLNKKKGIMPGSSK